MKLQSVLSLADLIKKPFYAPFSGERKRDYRQQRIVWAVVISVLWVWALYGMYMQVSFMLLWGVIVGGVVLAGLYSLLKKRTYLQLYRRERLALKQQQSDNKADIEAFAQQLSKGDKE